MLSSTVSITKLTPFSTSSFSPSYILYRIVWKIYVLLFSSFSLSKLISFFISFAFLVVKANTV